MYCKYYSFKAPTTSIMHTQNNGRYQFLVQKEQPINKLSRNNEIVGLEWPSQAKSGNEKKALLPPESTIGKRIKTPEK